MLCILSEKHKEMLPAEPDHGDEAEALLAAVAINGSYPGGWWKTVNKKQRSRIISIIIISDGLRHADGETEEID